jgi:DNA-binding NarL/FixJ family response regulator
VLRIVIAEDAALLREGLVHILVRARHEVAAALGDATALADAVERHQPDLVVTDVRLPPTHTDEGLRAALAIRATHPRLPILVLSQYIAHSYAAQLLESSTDGGIGYLLKDRVAQVTRFIDTVEQVAAGAYVVDPEVVRQLLTRRRDPLSRLTAREREVLALMAEGHANATIARLLTVTDAAIHKHINAIFTKLDIPNSGNEHRRVRAVLTYLRGNPAGP